MERYINADKLIKFIADGLNNPDKDKAFGHDAIEILAEIEFMVDEDVTSVVRCKDCCNSEQCGSVLYCSYFNHNVEENDYCSQGG